MSGQMSRKKWTNVPHFKDKCPIFAHFRGKIRIMGIHCPNPVPFLSHVCPQMSQKCPDKCPAFLGQMSCEKWTNVPWCIGNPPICFQQASNRIIFPVHLYATVRNPLSIGSKCQQTRHSTGNNVTPLLPPCYYVTDSRKQKQGQHHSAPCFCKNLFMKYCCPLPVTTVVLVILTLPSGLFTVRSFTPNSPISMLLCVGIL